MSSKKCKGSCLSASAKKALRGKSQGGKVSKTAIRIGLMLAWDKGSCFEQERLLTLDEEDF